jgi:hypothetical protein
MKKLQSTLVVLIGSLFTLISCQSSKEIHYFSEGDNYYRLKIKQHAFLSSSRYISGYFEPYAIDKFFGEMTRPDSAKIASDAKVKAIDSQGKQISGDLVMVLSTNADAVTKEIGGIAENEQLFSIISTMANKDELIKIKGLENKLQTVLTELGNQASDIDLTIESLKGELTAKAKTDELVRYLNNVAVNNNNLSGVKKLEDIESWLMNIK